VLSLYLSLPFCQNKCSYCDLNAYAGLNDLIPAYVEALAKEIRMVGGGTDSVVHTVYFGGGTPSITPMPLLAELFAALRASFSFTPDFEISFEANPDTLDLTYLAGLKQLGVNRLSIGAQSAQPNELALFQRTHTFADVEQAMGIAREAGFENVSLDLIYGVPGQTMVGWQDTVARALALHPDHFSVYALSYDFETPMRAWIQRGLLAEPDGNLAAEMYEWVDSVLGEAGYGQYEISTWAKGLNSENTTFACRHNLQYWHNQPYLGLGAGAHGFWEGKRYANVASPTAYVNRMKREQSEGSVFSPALQGTKVVDRLTEMNETMLTGLRLVREGVSAAAFRERFGVGVQESFPKVLDELVQRKLIYWDGDRVKLTQSARMVSNWVFEKFV